LATARMTPSRRRSIGGSLEAVVSWRGTRSSNPSPSSGESATNRSGVGLDYRQPSRLAGRAEPARSGIHGSGARQEVGCRHLHVWAEERPLRDNGTRSGPIRALAQLRRRSFSEALNGAAYHLADLRDPTVCYCRSRAEPEIRIQFPPAVSQANFRIASLARPDLVERQPELVARHLTAVGDTEPGSL
jgi:hypothetical protein